MNDLKQHSFLPPTFWVKTKEEVEFYKKTYGYCVITDRKRKYKYANSPWTTFEYLMGASGVMVG